LAILARDRVAVDVYVREFVVQADLLKLLVHLDQSPRIPQPHLRQHMLVLLGRLPCELGRGRELTFLDLVQLERPASELDVVLDVGPLHSDLVGFDNQPLNRSGHQLQGQEPERSQGGNGNTGEPDGWEPL